MNQLPLCPLLLCEISVSSTGKTGCCVEESSNLWQMNHSVDWGNSHLDKNSATYLANLLLQVLQWFCVLFIYLFYIFIYVFIYFIYIFIYLFPASDCPLLMSLSLHRRSLLDFHRLFIYFRQVSFFFFFNSNALVWPLKMCYFCLTFKAKIICSTTEIYADDFWTTFHIILIVNCATL